MLNKLNTRQKAILVLIIANIIWGAASPIFKYSLESIPPFTLAFLRFSIASLILFPFVHKELHKLTSVIDNWKEIFLFSIFGTTINITFFFLALKSTESINAPIIGSSGPIIILIFSVLFLHEKAGLKKILGMLLSFFGILIIILEPVIKHGLDGSVIGNIFLVIATLGAVGQTLIGKKVTKKYSPLPLTFWSFIIGSITFIPMMIPELKTLPPLDVKSVIGIVYGSIFSSFIAYSLYAWGLSKIDASEAGLFAYIDPVIAIVIAYPLLGEKPTSLFLLGSVLVFFGIYITERRLNYHPIKKLLRT